MEQGLTPQSEEPQGSRDETGERLSSMIQEKGLRGCVGPIKLDGRWALLFESSTGRFVVLDGIKSWQLSEAHNDEYKLVATGGNPSFWCRGFVTTMNWPGAKDLANEVSQIMLLKRKYPSGVSALCQKTADLGLPIYDLDLDGGWHARLRGPEEQGDVPRPPSALSAASPSLLAQGPLDYTAAFSSAPLDLDSYISSHELAAALAHAVTRSSGQHSRNGGGGDPAATELLADNDLETGRQAPRVGARRIGGGATAPGQEPLDLVSVIMDNSAMHPPFGTDMYFSWGHLRILIQGYASGHIAFSELAAALQHVVTRSSGPRGRNGGGGDPAATEFLVRPLELLTDYDLEAGREAQWVGAWRPGGGAAYDLEAGREAQRVGAWRPGGGAAAPVQEPSDRLQRVLEQVFAAFLPACATAYSLLKDAPDHVKFIIFGGLAFSAVGLFVGMLSNSVARRGQAIRLVSFSAVAVLTFSVSAQLSSPIYIALTALVGVAVNLIIMLLRF